jgi:hypothetical protein
METGRLWVRTGPAGTAVELPGGRVTVAPHSVVEIALAAHRPPYIAAFIGSYDVAWRAAETTRPLPPPAPSAVRPSAVRPPSASASGTAFAEAPPDTPLQAESRLLSQALHRLRADRDPDGALALLHTYRTRFADGQLRPEAQAAQAEALLRRAEHHAEAGRCREALPDFSAVFATTQGTPAAVEERARYGRASCRARLGDRAGAQADLRAYLERFPAGRFADAAYEALGK